MRSFYSNRNETDIAFKPELDAWCKRSGHIKVYYTVTDCQPHERGCLRGVIDTTMVASRVDDIADRFFYMMGPPKMVEAMKRVCTDIGCSPDRIKMENFVGY